MALENKLQNGRLYNRWYRVAIFLGSLKPRVATYLRGLRIFCATRPIAGILIADYFILRKSTLNIDALFQHAGEYGANNGWTWRVWLRLL